MTMLLLQVGLKGLCVSVFFRRMTRCAALAAAGLALAACGGASVSQPAAPSADAQVVSPPDAVPLPTGDAGVSIVARVNGEVITLEAFQHVLERAEQQQLAIADVSAFQDGVLSMMIEQSLINQAAAQQGIAITDAELDAEVQQSQAAAGSAEAWAAWLASNSFSEADFRSSLRDALITARLRDAITGPAQTEVPAVRARHILVSSQAEAQDLFNQLNAGADFAALAAQFSRDETSRATGGDLGWFTEDELLQPALAYAAFASQPGALVGPVRSELGYHVLQVLERENRPIAPERWPALAQARFNNWLTSAVMHAAVERFLQ
jgi:peptidyl-prolyl cis-trans isomerase C